MRMPSSTSGSSQNSGSPSPPPALRSSRASRRRSEENMVRKTGYPLQRGSACLSCRKRKMKCDAGKPACSQCVRANRAIDCDYDDGKSKSRTQLLQEKITTLETRLRNLEGSPSSQAGVLPNSLHSYNNTSVDHQHGSLYGEGDILGTGGSTASSLELTSISTTTSPGPGTPEDGWPGDQYDLSYPGRHNLGGAGGANGDVSWDAISMSSEDLLKASGRWWENETLPFRISQLLIDIFMPHRFQCGLEIDATRFQATLNTSDAPHPALLNSIYALACHFSLSPILAQHESRFVNRTLRSISTALEKSDRLLHVLQGSCLLAIFFFIKGRLLEGYYHAGSAVRLAVGLGLHQVSAPTFLSDVVCSQSQQAVGSVVSTPILPPATNPVEFGERVLTFWQVYCLDRCWAVATGLPVALSEDSHPRTRIETVWPCSLEEYEMGQLTDSSVAAVGYLRSKIVNIPHSGRESANSLRAKAATLFERCNRLALCFGSLTQNLDKFWSEFRNLEGAITHLLGCLPSPYLSLEDPQVQANAKSRIDMHVFVTHSLLHAAMIKLHSPFAFKDAISRQKALTSALSAATMAQDLEDVDIPFLDPIMGTCWTSVAEVLIQDSVGSAAAMNPEIHRIAHQLDVIILAMNRLGATLPLVAYQARKVEQTRIVSF